MTQVEILQLAMLCSQRKFDGLREWESITRMHAKRPSEPVACVTCDSCTESHCCCQAVLTSLFEGVLIAQRIAKLPDGQTVMLKVVEHAQEQGKLLDPNKLWLESASMEQANQEWKRGVDQWFDKRVSCPLLAKGRCLLYDIRPLMCASHFLVDEPSSHCHPSYKGVVGALNNIEIAGYALQLDGQFLAAITGEPNAFGPPMLLSDAILSGYMVLDKGASALNRHELSGDNK